MVAVIKSLFVTHAAAQDTPSFFQKCSQTIRQIQFGNLYMGMILVKLNDEKMTISSAGMPLINIYRHGTQAVEELIIKALPLGATASFSSEVKILKLETGDTVLLLSDGYIELFNDQDEMLDYPRVLQYFQDVGKQSPDAIVAQLIERGDQWRNGRSQLDDITLVVFKMKAVEDSNQE
ncbi:MAG: PP2C family protein-serine/threonine phosphatase [Candidatus Zhuqueibacterota bacterium]